MLPALLVQNLVHGAVALTWIVGLRRFAGRLSAGAWADLLRLAIVLPPILTVWHLLELPGLGDGASVLRSGLWAEALWRAGPVWVAIAALFLLGTTIIFVLQEALPAWRYRRGRLRAPHRPEPRLEAALERVRGAYARSDLPGFRGRPPRVGLLETDELLAGLQGMVEPRIVFSRGLLAILDEDELEAAVAHELAHLVRGGNLRLLGIWILRALQAFNPASLVLFRGLTETEESACDEVAVRMVGKPVALASALLKAHGRPPTVPEGAGRILRARYEVLRRADTASTRQRVRALLDQPRPLRTPPMLFAGSALLMTLLLWSIA